MVLIPLRELVQNGNDVAGLMRQIFEDIKKGKRLNDFEVARKLSPGRASTFMEGIVLKPSFMGIGFDLKTIPKLFRGK